MKEDHSQLNVYEFCGGNPEVRLDPSGLEWTWPHFWQHYRLGAGEPVDLGDVGLGRSFENSTGVRLAIEEFNFSLGLRAMKDSRDACYGKKSASEFFTFVGYSVRLADVTFEPGLFCVGRAGLQRQGYCSVSSDCCFNTYTIVCQNAFWIRDAFVKPFFTNVMGIEVGFKDADPYPKYEINYDFSRLWDSTGFF